MKTFLLFTLSGRRFALPLEALRQVVRMVEITPLPEAPFPVCGVINVQGETVPVLDLRALCALAPAPPAPEHHLILAVAAGKAIALPVDATEEIVTLPEEKTTALEGVISGSFSAEGIAPGSGDLVFIIDPKHLLSRTPVSIEALHDANP